MAIQFATKISIQRLNDKYHHKNIIYEPTKQNDGALEFNKAESPGSFLALRPVFFVIPNAVNLEFLKFIFF